MRSSALLLVKWVAKTAAEPRIFRRRNASGRRLGRGLSRDSNEVRLERRGAFQHDDVLVHGATEPEGGASSESGEPRQARSEKAAIPSRAHAIPLREHAR
jgi:hypothetical protein